MDSLVVCNDFANVSITDKYLWELIHLVLMVGFNLGTFPIRVVLGGSPQHHVSPTSHPWYWLMGLKVSKPWIIQ